METNDAGPRKVVKRKVVELGTTEPRGPPIIVTDGPLSAGYYLVAREGYGLRVIRVLKDGTREPVDEAMYERVKTRKFRMKMKR